MHRIIIICLIACLGFACKHKTGPAIIPENKFKEILIEIHLIDAYYMMHFNQYLNVKDSSSFYKQVFERNGVTRANFDTSLVYYAKDPKKFEAIYDEVITEFNRMSQDISDIRTLIMDSAKNLYRGRRNIIVKGQGFADRLPFEVEIKDTGLYTITVQLQIFNDDMSKDVKLTAYSTCKGCKNKETFNYFDKLEYKRIPQLKVYKVSKRIKNRSEKVIKGFILDQTEQKTKFHRHITVAWIFVNKTVELPKPQNTKKLPVDPILPKHQFRDIGKPPHVP